MYNDAFKAILIQKKDFTPEERDNYEHFIEALTDLVLRSGSRSEDGEK